MQDGGAGAEAGSSISSMQTLLSLLGDGEEQARQLGEMVVAAADAEHYYRGAARRLQSTLGKAAAVARAMEAAGSTTSRGTDDRSDDSPRSADESSGRTTTTTVAAAEAQEQRQGMCKRRKGLPRWTAKFRVPDASLEATPDDGFSWRKYGQKDILGAKFPRGYYRCTYRAAQSCQATKQVQRSDTDLCVFDVKYQGDHTCHQKQRVTVTVPAATAAHSPPPPPPGPLEQQQDPNSMQLLGMGFKQVLKVETAGLGLLHDHDYGPASASFSLFPSAVPPFHHHAGEAATTAADFSISAPASSYFVSSAPQFDLYDYDEARVRGGAESSELGEVVSRAITAAAATPAAAAFDDYSSLFEYHQAELDPHLPFPPPFGGGPPHGPFQ